MFLDIKDGNTTKKYLVTESFAKPYIHVSTGVLPLTTVTTTGLQLKYREGAQTYRAMDYVSSSTSASYLTSSADAGNMSSVTALTRASTSDTQYLTRASTSDTSYGTRASTSGTNYGTQYATRISTSSTVYGTRASTSDVKYGTRASTSNTVYGTAYATRASTSNTVYGTRASTSATIYLTRASTSGTNYGTKTAPGASDSLWRGTLSQWTHYKATTDNCTSSYVGYGTSGSKPTNNYYILYGNPAWATCYRSTYYAWGALYTESYAYSGTRVDLNQGNGLLTNVTKSDATSTVWKWAANNANYTYDGGLTVVKAYTQTLTQTTGTTYLTRASTSGTSYATRISTSGTTYLTRASTSGTKTTGTTYQTRASTSGTTYYTRASTSGTTYLTRASTSGTLTTGTTYLTCVSTSGTTYYTRISTSDTQYLTRESTSGYSGVSSSSTETITWQ